MDPTLLLIPASLLGTGLGLLTLWNGPAGGKERSAFRQIMVLLTGTVAFVVSVLFFGRALGTASALFAATATGLAGAWTSVLSTVVPLGLPAWMRKVSSSELTLLRRRWTGVPLFGAVLRRTPLRRLGGAVYLTDCGNESACVLRGIQTAEAVHGWSVLLSLPWLVFWCWQRWWSSVAVSLAVHVIVNFYPIFHLRLTRGRMERCAAKLAKQPKAERLSQ